MQWCLTSRKRDQKNNNQLYVAIYELQCGISIPTHYANIKHNYSVWILKCLSK